MPNFCLQEHLVLSYCPTDPAVYLFNPNFTKTVEVEKRTRSFSFFSSSQTNAATHHEEFDPLSYQSVEMRVEQLAEVASVQRQGLHRWVDSIFRVFELCLFGLCIVMARRNDSSTQITNKSSIICNNLSWAKNYRNESHIIPFMRLGVDFY